MGVSSRCAASATRCSVTSPEATRSVIVFTSWKPDRVSEPELIAAATRSGTVLSSSPQARELMIPVSELT